MTPEQVRAQKVKLVATPEDINELIESYEGNSEVIVGILQGWNAALEGVALKLESEEKERNDQTKS